MKTEKTATGLSRLVIENGYTNWFNALQPIIAEKVENQPGKNGLLFKLGAI